MARIPGDRDFATKPQLAQAMIERALLAGVPFAWVTADEAYGQVGALRLWLERHGVAHVLAVPKSQAVISMDLRQRRAHTVIAEVAPQAWQRISCGDGAHGRRLYDWAVVDIRPLRDPRYGHWLLARRSISDRTEIAYYLCFGPAGTAVPELVRVAGSRWAIEECFQTAKNETGLDHYQVRDYTAWYRHITLSMAAAAFLLLIHQDEKKGAPRRARTPVDSVDDPRDPALVQPDRPPRPPPARAHLALVVLATNMPSSCPRQPLQTQRSRSVVAVLEMVSIVFAR